MDKFRVHNGRIQNKGKVIGLPFQGYLKRSWVGNRKNVIQVLRDGLFRNWASPKGRK